MKRTLPLIGLLVALIATTGPAVAEPRQGKAYPDRLLQLVERGRGGDEQPRMDQRSRGESRGGISLDEAVSRVQRATGGRVLSAESRGGYRIKVLLPGGRVRIYQVDPDSGAGLP